jgi:hypothetical protein
MRPVGVGLASFEPIGRGGVEDHDLLAGFCALDRFLLGQELGALVVADHVGEETGVSSLTTMPSVRSAWWRRSRCRRRAARRPRGPGAAARACRRRWRGTWLRVGNPEAVVGGDVDHGVAAGEGGLQRRRVGEIADMRFRRDAFEVGEVAGFADQQAQVCAFERRSSPWLRDGRQSRWRL